MSAKPLTISIKLVTREISLIRIWFYYDIRILRTVYRSIMIRRNRIGLKGGGKEELKIILVDFQRIVSVVIFRNVSS